MRRRGRHLVAAAGCLIAIAAAAAAGCGSSSEGDPVLTIYLSAPLSGPRAADGQDVADGAQLALADAGEAAAGTSVELEVLDDAGPEGWDAALSGANARAATQDSSAIAYLGEVDSGASRTSIPITNEAGILQVSPAAGAEDLTRDAIGSDIVPTMVQPSGARTFGRVIPSDRTQGQAAGGWMSKQGIASVTVLGGEDPFGQSLVAGLLAASPGPAVAEKGTRGDALLVADEDAARAAELPSNGVPIFASDALLEGNGPATLERLGSACSPAGCTVRIASAALDPSQLPAAASTFLDDFQAEYDRRPGRLAAYGYEAMAVVLDSIERAEDPTDRGSVVDAFFATSDRDSILGTYSIDEVGDTTLDELGAYVVRGDRVSPEPEPLEAG